MQVDCSRFVLFDFFAILEDAALITYTVSLIINISLAFHQT